MTLSADNLSLVRGGAQVLSDVSASLKPGTITAIVGPNGAGKSSLLLALAGLLEPASGGVSLDGEKLSDMALQSRAKALGYLPQGADVAWDVSVEALVALGRMPHRDARQEPVDAAIAALALEDLRHRPVSRLSGGEKARTLLARVLAGEPRWILADEPLAALDLAHQLNLVGHFKRSAKAGAGIAIVLHDLSLARNHANTVLVLDRGQLVANAAPDEALTPDIIKQVWGVPCEWVGLPGQQALIPRGS